MSQKGWLLYVEHSAVTRSSFIIALLVAPVLPVLLFVIYKVFRLSHSQYLQYNWAKCFCCTTWVLPRVTDFDITATSDQSLQEHRKSSLFLLIFFILTWLFHPCWKSWTGAPNFSQENEAVCKCWYCKYTGSVLFLEHFYVFEKHVIYSKQLLLSWFLVKNQHLNQLFSL